MQKKNLLSIIAIIFITVLTFSGCKKNIIFYKFEKIPPKNWDKNNFIIFKPTINDTLSVVNISILIRHNNSYPNQNLFLFVKTISPLGFYVKDTVLINLADDKGKWYGKGFANIWTHEILYKKNVKFPFQGIYTFQIEQAMRNNPLPGIVNIGIKISKN